MKFAINYSSEAAELLARGEIRVDLFKCPPWPDVAALARSQCATYIHYPLRAGRGAITEDVLDNIAAMLNISDTRYVNVHLAPHAGDFDGMPLDTHEHAHTERLATAMLRDIMMLVKNFGSERVILENSMWDPHPRFRIPRPVLEPQLICRMINETGCGLLLDIPHAAISAKHLDMDEREYFSALPIEHLRDLHVTGTSRLPNGDLDDHYAMREEDWSLTEWAIERIRTREWPEPWAMTFEYGGFGASYEKPSEIEIIAQQAPRLYELAGLSDR